jgi:hypothetical protein
MKVTLQIKLKNGIKLPVTHDVNTFADLKKFGEKIAALPAGANKLMPGIADVALDGMGIEKEQAAAAA